MGEKRKKINRLIAVVSGLMLLLLVILGINLYSNSIRKSEEVDLASKYLYLQAEIQRFIDGNANLMEGFGAYIQAEDELRDDQINKYLELLLADELDTIRNVGIMDGTVISWVYPVEGNEEIIGVDLMTIPGQGEQVAYIIETGNTLLVGPINLVQGGIGYIIRVPIFKEGDYWGGASIVLDGDVAKSIFDEIASSHDVDYLITEKDKPDRVIFGSSSVLQKQPIKILNQDNLYEWDIYIIPSEGWFELPLGILIGFLLIGAGISLYTGKRIYRFLNNYYELHDEHIELVNYSTKDRFTGIFNRGYFDARIMQEMAFSNRNETDLSILYFDIDNFKSINDTYGHGEGDKVLLKLTNLVKELIRSSDVFARWGGDEFVILLPSTGLEGAKKLGEKIGKAVDQLTFEKVAGITISVGAATYTPHEYWPSLFRRVDEALYEAKKAGKNKVVCSDHYTAPIQRKLIWDLAWNTGHPAIDKEHQELLLRCNETVEFAFEEGQVDDVIRASSNLLETIQAHFEHEESILQEIGYPDYDQHRYEHTKLMMEAKNILEKVQQRFIKTEELFHFLSDTVIMDHIVSEDQNYIPYLGKAKH